MPINFDPYSAHIASRSACSIFIKIGCTATDFTPLHGSKPAREPGVILKMQLGRDSSEINYQRVKLIEKI